MCVGLGKEISQLCTRVTLNGCMVLIRGKERARTLCNFIGHNDRSNIRMPALEKRTKLVPKSDMVSPPSGLPQICIKSEDEIICMQNFKDYMKP